MPGPERSKCSATSPSAKDERSKVGCRRPKPQKSSLEVQWHGNSWEKNCKTGIIGLDRLKVRWDVALFLAPVVRHDAFYALLFCLAVRVYVYFSPHLSRGSTGWVGVGGGSCNPRHAPDVTLYRSSLAILDTLMMLRSIDLLLQSSTRSRCYAL